MTDTFVPVMQPSTNSGLDEKARINRAQFGDGYSQRSEDGLNAVPGMFSAVWPMLQEVDANTMKSFFRAHKSTSFFWTPPGDIQRKWIVQNFRTGYASAGVVSLSAVFEEVFDL